MQTCTNCKQEFDDKQFFCPFDGEILRDNFVINGKYAVEKKIGQGGMGFVYKARHTILGHHVAVKILKPGLAHGDSEAKNRFLREAQIMASLDHENIIKIKDFDSSNSYAFFVMEFLNGKNLKQKITESNTLSLEEISGILKQICSAVGYAHKNRVLHRDLKPSNIFLMQTDEGAEKVKVLDFGIAKVLDPEETKITKTNFIVGAPSYMSPEQSNTQKDIDFRADIYSLGIVLYELLCGKVPSEAETPLQIGMMHLNHQPKLMSANGRDVTPEIEKVVQKALAKKRDDRHQSMAELAGEFESAIQRQDFSNDLTLPDEALPVKNETKPIERMGDTRQLFNNDFGGSKPEQINFFQGENKIENLFKSEGRRKNKDDE